MNLQEESPIVSTGDPLKHTTLSEKRKARTFQRLVDRYYGKKDLLNEWELFPDVDPDYKNDLARRVNGHYNDLVYRGANPEEIT